MIKKLSILVFALLLALCLSGVVYAEEGGETEAGAIPETGDIAAESAELSFDASSDSAVESFGDAAADSSMPVEQTSTDNYGEQVNETPAEPAVETGAIEEDATIEPGSEAPLTGETGPEPDANSEPDGDDAGSDAAPVDSDCEDLAETDPEALEDTNLGDPYFDHGGNRYSFYYGGDSADDDAGASGNVTISDV